MSVNHKGYLLLEGMLAMFIVASSILFTIAGIIFMLNDEKKCQEELEIAIFLYEMSSAVKSNQENNPDMIKKAHDNQISIRLFEKNQLEIEREKRYYTIEKNE